MKFILASALIATCYATASPATRNANSDMYMKFNIHCPGQGTIDGTQPPVAAPCVLKSSVDAGNMVAHFLTNACVESNIVHQFLVRVPYGRGTATSSTTTNGTCINFIPGNNTANAYTWSAIGATMTKSLSFVRHDTDDKATLVHYSAPGCTGTATVGSLAGGVSSGFFFNDAAVQGKWKCGGAITGALAAKTDLGLDIGAVTQVDKAMASASRWTNKKNFAGQLIGPFSTNACKALPAFGGTVVHYPVVMPLEDAPTHAPQSNPATTQQYNGELAIGATERCWNSGVNKNGTVAGEAINFGIKTAAVGSFTIKISSGTDAQRVFPPGDTSGAVTCTEGATVHSITYSMDYTGVANLCVQSKNKAGTDSGSYFLFAPADYTSIGGWMGNPQIPASASSPGGSSPASSLHLSAAVAAMIGLIHMMF